MRKQTILRFASVVPLLALNFNLSFADISGRIADLHSEDRIEAMIIQAIQEQRAEAIDRYFSERSMPLKGYGMKMVEEAKKNDIDWRLIPAIAIRESSGGKFACKYNPFGWDSCKARFESTDHAIEVIARNLGGNNPKTQKYYGTEDTKEKLYHYNGSVIPRYPDEVLRIMDRIGETNDLNS